MESRNLALVAISMAILALSSSAQKTSPPPILTPTPAPAPAQEFVNLTDLLSVAGPFKTFLGHLISTKVIDTLQNQANDTEEGVTIFVPKDSAFTAQKNMLKNLTSEQLKQVMLFHALPHFYTFSDFGNLSESSPVNTMAGGGLFSLNFSDTSGSIRVDSGWTKTKISSSVHSSDPCAVYQIDRVLIPEAIFGTDLPPMPAPAPAPEADAAGSPDADSPAADAADSPAKSSPGKSGSPMAAAGLSHILVSAVAAVLAVVL